MKRLQGRVAVVTGAGQGIGREIALLLAAEGANLVINDLEPNAAAACVRDLEALDIEAIAVVGNVTDSGFAERLAEETRARFGDVHIIVNNAGYVWNDPLHRISDEQWEAMQAVHLQAPFRILRAFHPLLREGFGRDRAAGRQVGRKVINVASVAATRGAAGQAAYASAKAGLFGLTRSLAKEWGPLNVTVNCVAYGLIDTRLTRVLADGESGVIDIDGVERRVGFTAGQREGLLANIALGRTGTAREAAGGAFILCLPEADYVTGQCLEITGGLVY